MKNKELVVHDGQMTSSGRLRARGLLYLGPPILWLILLLVVPTILLCLLGFMSRGDYGEVVWQPTVANFRRLAGYGIMGWSADYLRILWRSLVVATVTTVFAVLLGYPLAFFIASRSPRMRYVWLALVVVPLCTNIVIRSYAWMLILHPAMPVARVAHLLGFVPENTPLFPSPLAVYLGMLSNFLPFAALPLYTSVERIDWSIIEAAEDLYASRWRTFRHAILPQTMPGLVSAFILTFIPALGAFVIPDLLGGAKYMLVGNLVQQQFGASRDWPFGAAISLGLMIVTFIGLIILARFGQKEEVK